MTQHADGGESRSGLFAALKNTLATLLEIGKTRADLVVTELEEEKNRLLGQLVRIVSAAVLLAAGGFLAVQSLAVLFWEQRALVFGIFALIFLAFGLFIALAAKRGAARPERLLRSSIAELEADIEQLRRHASKPE